MNSYPTKGKSIKKSDKKKDTKRVQLGSRVKLKYCGETDEEAVTYLVTPYIDVENSEPQIETTTDLGKAILEKEANKHNPIYFHDSRRGIVGVYILEIL